MKIRTLSIVMGIAAMAALVAVPPRSTLAPIGVEKAAAADAAAETADTEAQTTLGTLLTAIQADDYEGFMRPMDDVMKAALTKPSFEVLVGQFAPRLRRGYESKYLTDLRKKDFKTYLWKLTFKDGGEELVAEMSIQDHKVNGLYFR
jgi:hypothetical protein